MRKRNILLLLLGITILSLSLYTPIVNVLATIPPWTVVVATSTGVMILVAWGDAVGALRMITLRIGKPPPRYDNSHAIQEMNTDLTDYPETMLTSLLNGNMVGTGHNYSR